MTNNIYNDEAIIRSVTYHGKAGHKISLELDPAGWERLKGMETTRCMMVLVPIQNDGQPDPDAAQAAAPATEGKKPRRPMSSLPRAQQAGILCRDEQFWNFLSLRFPNSSRTELWTAGSAAIYVRKYCGGLSRTDIDGNPESERLFDGLRTEFGAWRHENDKLD